MAIPSVVGATISEQMRRTERLALFGRRMIEQRIREKAMRAAERKMGSIARFHIYASADELKERLVEAWGSWEKKEVTEEMIDKELDKLNY